MTRSNATPLQFWLTGQESFNEKEEAGVVQHCFLQPWKCSDPLTDQFTDTVERLYKLLIYDENDVLLSTQTYSKVANSTGWTYYISFTPSSIGGLCDKRLRFKIAYYENTIDGEATDYLETVAGTATFVSDFFELVGDTDDYIETVSGGEMVNSLEGAFKLGEVSEGAMCAANFETLYYSGPAPWGTGKIMYSDKELTSPILGYLFITDASGTGYNMDDATGEVLTTTGNVC